MELPRRKRIRLEEYDYSSQGAYFVTICTYERKQILSCICRGDPCGRPKVELFPLGKIAEETLAVIENNYHVIFDYYVVMPDHIHFVVFFPDGTAVNKK